MNYFVSQNPILSDLDDASLVSFFPVIQHKSHHFDYTNDVAMLVGDCKPGIGGEPLLGQIIKPKHSVFPKGEGSAAPAWVAFDRQVLCFDAFFQEAVHEKREEQYRVRRCNI